MESAKSALASSGVQAIDPQALINAYSAGYEPAYKANVDVQKEAFNRQQDIQATATKEVQKAQIEATATRHLGDEDLKKVDGINDAFTALDNVENKYGPASQSWFFGGPVKGAGFVPAAMRGYDDRVKQYNASVEGASAPLAQGVLGLTPGADSKAAVMEKMNQMLPNELDSQTTASGKLMQMRGMAFDHLVQLRNSRAAAHYDTTPIDQTLQQWAPRMADYQKNYQQQMGSVVTSNTSNPIGIPQADPHLDQLIQSVGPKPQPQPSPLGQ